MTVATTKGERTRSRLLATAIEAFGANGFRATSVATVARAAMVSPAAVFSYWPSKEALFEAAVDTDARAVIDELLDALGPEPGIDRWVQLVDELLKGLDRHPLSRRVLAGHEPDVIDRVLELGAFDDLRERIAESIAAAQARQAIRTDLDPRRAAVGMETITIALSMALLQLREPTNPLREAGVAEILLAAFRPSA